MHVLFRVPGNSGLLVHAVKKMAMEKDRDCELFLIDGPAGSGCPLISTISGVDVVLIVTEPSVSGLHDLKRVVADMPPVQTTNSCCHQPV